MCAGGSGDTIFRCVEAGLGELGVFLDVELLTGMMTFVFLRYSPPSSALTLKDLGVLDLDCIIAGIQCFIVFTKTRCPSLGDILVLVVRL